jgi:hypothetical protein
LLDSGREGFSGISGLGCSQPDELSARKSESRGDEDAADSLETIVERARVVPVMSPKVVVVRTSAAVENYTENAGGVSDQQTLLLVLIILT